MNISDVRDHAIVEADDFQDKYDRNGLNFLFWWKAKNPDFKISLFTIPDKTTPAFIDEVAKHDWIEFLVHGWNHDSNFECYGWSYDTAKLLLNRVGLPYKRIFKAPGWTITPGYNGYPAAPEQPIAQDPLGVYRALMELDYIVVDRHYNKVARPKGLKVICIDCQPDIVHMHTWPMDTPNHEDRNGFEQVEMRGVPWIPTTKFTFMSEAWEQGLIRECE